MRRGTRSTAAGRFAPGTPPLLARTSPTYFPHSAPRISVFLRTISNRHLVRLEITATPAESTSSLFLIDPKQHVFPRADFNSPEFLVTQACLVPVRFAFPSNP